MTTDLEEMYKVDVLAKKAGGYFSIPDEDELAYTDLLFSVCNQFGIRYYNATPKERFFVEEVTRVTWEHQNAQTAESIAASRPAFAI